MTDFTGTSGNDTLTGTAGNDQFTLSQGGSDTVSAGAGDDTFVMGSAFDPSDALDGGDGYDILDLNGDYSLSGFLTATSFTNIEQIDLEAAHNYWLTLADGNVAAGQSLIVNGSLLGAGDSLTVVGGNETDGSLHLVGGAGNDLLSAGAGDDLFDVQLGGNDRVFGGGGDDSIYFGAALTTDDVIDGGAGTDTVRLQGDYSAGLRFGTTTMFHVEQLTLVGDFNYKLITSDSTVNAGQTLAVLATEVGNAFGLTFNGSRETDGSFNITSGAGDDSLTGGAQDDTFNIGAGGIDRVNGGAGNDSIYAYKTLTAADHIDGGVGIDTLYLDGDYSAGLTFHSTTIQNVEQILVATGHSYKFVTQDDNVAAGEILYFGGDALGAGDTLSVNGSHETDAHLNMSGGKGNDTLIGGARDDAFTLFRGGEDTVKGGDGNDLVYVGAALDAGDKIDGGADSAGDVVVLTGDYSAGLRLSAHTIENVEELRFEGEFNYKLVSHDGTVAAGQVLSVASFYLSSAYALDFNGARETDGAFSFLAGAGDDTLTGGASADFFEGGGGADHLTGDGGADTFAYTGAADSTSGRYDTIFGFDATTDLISGAAPGETVDPIVAGGLLRGGSHFDGDLAAAVGAGQLGAFEAVLFKPDSGGLAGSVFLVVDGNGTAGYQAGEDLVIKLDHPLNLASFGSTNFI